MTTTDVKVLNTMRRTVLAALSGLQMPLVLTEAPAAHADFLNLPIDAQVWTADGEYYCLIPLGGLASELTVTVQCTLNSMTCTLTLDELADFDPRVTNVADAEILSTSSNDGAMTTDTLMQATLSLSGGKYARARFTLAGTPTSVTWTRAEVAGL